MWNWPKGKHVHVQWQLLIHDGIGATDFGALANADGLDCSFF